MGSPSISHTSYREGRTPCYNGNTKTSWTDYFNEQRKNKVNNEESNVVKMMTRQE